MSGFGGFGGFGQNNNNNNNNTQQSTGFGGFGSTNTNTGFGSTANTGFGSTNTNTGGGLFGSNNNNTTGGFGGSGGGFGSTTSAFGAKPSGFGNTATTGTGLFGGSAAPAAASTGFGGFGTNNQPATGGFGSTNTGGSLFGAKPATTFGAAAATPSTGFGGFGGASTTTGGFGATALGGSGECQGTGNTPFAATVEKEPNTTTNQQNSFQNICFQQPYQKWSPEELRLTDYAQGRRYGNASNQAGTFGQSTGFGGATTTPSTGFGGFGAAATNTNTTGSLFGNNSTATTAFGSAQPTSTGFGSNTGTSLFGANKPATGGLFGSTPAQNTGGGLFGNTNNNNNTTTGFGSTPAAGGFGSTNNNASGGLFGNNAAANKPAGFSFGQQPAASTGTGFGAGAAPTSGGFGGGLFGNNNNNNATTNTASPFGNAQQPAAASNPFGSFGQNNNTQQQNNNSTSLFGANNQQKPATGGLFGSTNTGTGGGLFGSTQQQQPAAGGLFGNANNTQQNTGGLFGQKPAATTGGLFGNTSTAQTHTGGGLFGSGFGQNNNNQNQTQQNSSSLFGQQKPATGGLFGGGQTQQQGSSLFGGNSTQQQGGGLFGNLNNSQQQQPQQQNSLFGNSSLFGGSQQGQQNSQSLTASINDTAAFGTPSMFRDLGNGPVNNPGPLATPLSAVNKQKRPAALPMYKLNSASSSRFATPQKRGFGFSYSNYGSPNSVSSTSSTPGNFGNSLLGGLNQQRGLSKSMSTNNLRTSFSGESSVLAPGAFSASQGARNYGSTGSMKKLVINRGIRGDLFSPPPQVQSAPVTAKTGGILKKRVSFDGNATSNGAQNIFSSPLKQVTNNATPSAEELGFIRPRPSSTTPKSNGVEVEAPEMEQVKGNELAIVHEEDASRSVKDQNQPPNEQDLGDYYMSPTKDEILAMNRTQRAKVSGLKVGRKGVGQVEFLVPVDLTNINPAEIVDNLVVFATRSCTVYPNVAQKPPMGKGLNVPSRISLNNSWPRKKDKRTISDEKSGPRFNKHVERLRSVPDTKFVDYDKDTGVWTFEVEHFTTYGLEYEDDETDGEGITQLDQSVSLAPPDTPTPRTRTPRSQLYDDSFASTSQLSRTESDPEDTFDFRRKKILPGAFDDQDLYEADSRGEDSEDNDQQSFLDERSVGSLSENGVDEPMDQDDVFQDDESVSIVDQEMAGSFPQADNTAELEDDSQDDESMDGVQQTPGALVRLRMRANAGRTPSKKFVAGDDWASMLKTTLSPQKQDRAHLKSLIDLYGNDSPRKADLDNTPVARSKNLADARGFATSIDLMNSLFGQAKSPKKAVKAPVQNKGFEWPYEKRPKTANTDMSDMDDTERAFHESMKPSWGADGTFVYAAPANPKQFGKSSRRHRAKDGFFITQKGGVVSERRDVRFARFSNEALDDVLNKQKAMTVIKEQSGVPYAQLTSGHAFTDLFEDRNARDPAAVHEKLVWELASILFDDIVIPDELKQLPNAPDRLRKDKLSSFWQKMVDQASSQHVAMARTQEEKVIAALAGHRIADACSYLIASKNFHLATLVALIGGKDSMRRDIREQLNEWSKSKVLSEFSQPIRAIYELLAGNVCVCDGTKGAPVEDRIETFIISKRFGLDWRQSFGLRLWYAIQTTENLQSAVIKFAEDLQQEKETARPQAWYAEQKIPALWEDEALDQREDLLWGLLKLYTLDNADLEAILRPENSQLSPLDSRLSWQLSRALTTWGPFISYGEDADNKSDRVTLSFAAQLINEGSWLDAIFVLLHLHSPEARAKAIQDHLAQNAGRIGTEDSVSFGTLTQTFKIPTTWIWEAKALYMRSVKKDPVAEVECLVRAGSFEEAHRTFAKEVAPKSIIEQDYDILNALLEGFHGKEHVISEWHLGGEIYSDFLILLSSQKKAGGVPYDVLERLLAGLPAMTDDSRHAEFMETVAIEIISNDVAKVVVEMGKKGKEAELPKVLRLPLTEDKFLRHTVDISIGYYKTVMAGGR